MGKMIYADFVVMQFTWEQIEALAPLAAFVHDCIESPLVPRFCSIIEFMMALARTQDIPGRPADAVAGVRSADGIVDVTHIPVAEDTVILDFALQVFDEVLVHGAPTVGTGKEIRSNIVTVFDWYKGVARSVSAQASEGGIAIQGDDDDKLRRIDGLGKL